MGFALFPAEYANMILVSLLAALFFLGGWLSPFQGAPAGAIVCFRARYRMVITQNGYFCFLVAMACATFPRYRYDQLMQLVVGAYSHNHIMDFCRSYSHTRWGFII